MVRRLVRVAVVAALVAFGNLTPIGTGVVSAVDCSAVFCATLEIVPSNGTGTGHVTSDPGGMDCTSTPTSRTGTCVFEFSWPHFIVGGIDVDLYLDPDGHSYVCQSSTCGGLDQTLVRTQHLNPGDNLDYFLVFNLGNKTSVTISASGNGGGRVTTSPAGLDCHVVAGVKSGTCAYDYWYLGDSVSLSLHRTPDAGSFACNGTFCGTPDKDLVSTLDVGPGAVGVPAAFWLAAPVSVSITGSGTVVSDPAGINCPSTCSAWFPPDTPPDDVTKLIATPAAGWYLKDWTGTACGATFGQTCTFANGYVGASVGVVFARLATPAPSATPKPTVTPPTAQPSGAVTPSPTGSPGATAGAASPGAETPVAGTPGPDASRLPGDPTAGPSALPGDDSTPAPSGAVPGGSSTSSPDPITLVLVVLLLVLALGLAVALRRRGRRTGAGMPTPPRA